MPGAVGAIVGARRARGKRPPPSIRISDERRRRVEEEYAKRQKLYAVLKKYDTNSSGKLERDQVIKLLTDLDNTTPPGTSPSEEEVDFIMKIADISGDGSLELKEIALAMSSWHVYTTMKGEMTDKLKEFDKSGTGKLEKPELKEYLKSLNGGKEVDDSEVDWVFGQADIFGDEGIRANELVIATTVWYTHAAEKREAQCCTMQ